MNEYEEQFTSGLMVGVVFSSLILFGLISGCINDTWKADAIKHNCAEYNQTTGRWNWKNE